MKAKGGVIITEMRRIAGVVSNRFMTDNYPDLTDRQKACISGVRFDCGHALEIIQRLKEYSAHDTMKFEKFPLIWLMTDFTVTSHRHGDYDGVVLEVVICHFTDRNRTTAQREVETFEPFLRPIYSYLYEEIERSPILSFPEDTLDKHEATERFFWGREGLYGNTGSVFNDYVDAIQVRNLDLALFKTC